MRSKVVVVLALLFLVRLSAIGQEKELSALDIFDRTLKAFDNQRAALRDYQYHQTLITHQFDASGAVTARGVWQSIVRPGDPRPLEYVGERMEGKLSFFKSNSSSGSASAPSSPSPTASPAKTQSPDSAEEKNQSETAVEAVHKYDLRDRYNWKRLPDENVTGEPTYVIASSRSRTRSRTHARNASSACSPANFG